MKFIILGLLLANFAIAAESGNKGSFQCMKVSLEGQDYVYCPHNQSLYSPVAVDEKKLSEIKKKLSKLRENNQSVEVDLVAPSQTIQTE